MKYVILFSILAVFTYHTLVSGLPVNGTNADFTNNQILNSNNITNSSVVLNILIGINGRNVTVNHSKALTNRDIVNQQIEYSYP